MIEIQLDAKLETFKADAPKVEGNDPTVTLTIKASVSETTIARLAQLLGDNIVVELHPRQLTYFRDLEPSANGHQRTLDDAVAEQVEDAGAPDQADAALIALARAAGDDVDAAANDPSDQDTTGETGDAGAEAVAPASDLVGPY